MIFSCFTEKLKEKVGGLLGGGGGEGYAGSLSCWPPLKLLGGRLLRPPPPTHTHLSSYAYVTSLIRNFVCTTIHRYPIFSTRYSVMCKVYTGYCGTSEIEHGLCACTVDNPLAKARGLSLRTGAQTMLCLSLVSCDDSSMA